MDTTENTTPTTETLSEKNLRPGSGYRGLRIFQLATIIYDATVSFCNRFVDRSSGTHDRMVQAARSGRQDIAQSSRVAESDSSAEVHLINAARNNFDELLLDYEDFLRQRKLRMWIRDDSEAQAVCNEALEHERSQEKRRNRDRLIMPFLYRQVSGHLRVYSRQPGVLEKPGKCAWFL